LTLIAISKHKKSQPMPFGPFIAAAGWIGLLWGDQIINAYLRSSGLA
jgi:leader peptidase (prepilin peptidase) / N-methyltransferase